MTLIFNSTTDRLAYETDLAQVARRRRAAEAKLREVRDGYGYLSADEAERVSRRLSETFEQMFCSQENEE